MGLAPLALPVVTPEWVKHPKINGRFLWAGSVGVLDDSVFFLFFFN